MVNPIVGLIDIVLALYWYVVIAAVIVSWLIAFNVINTYNQFVRSLLRALSALTEPVFRQIRRVIPPLGGLDLSPLVVMVLIGWLRFYVIPWAVTRFGLY
jgi:YggT family protein